VLRLLITQFFEGLKLHLIELFEVMQNGVFRYIQNQSLRSLPLLPEMITFAERQTGKRALKQGCYGHSGQTAEKAGWLQIGLHRRSQSGFLMASCIPIPQSRFHKNA